MLHHQLSDKYRRVSAASLQSFGDTSMKLGALKEAPKPRYVDSMSSWPDRNQNRDISPFVDISPCR